MKVFQIYNEQRSRLGGEPAVIENTVRVLEKHGHTARLIKRSSRDLEGSVRKQAVAFWSGIYNPGAKRYMARLLREDPPDVVHVHSVYPMFSPSILVACRQAGIPVVMTVHTYNLTCPTWFHLYKGKICDDCSGGREYNCVLKNCRNNVLESSAYALRAGVARKLRLFHNNVDRFIVLTPFSKQRMMRAGFNAEQISVVPNPTSLHSQGPRQDQGHYVGFSGRISPEKGLDVFLSAAARLSDIPFKIAGDGPGIEELKLKAPPNVEFVGRLEFSELVNFYRNARMLVVPSVWFEPFGMVVVDAMALGVPVVASNIGGLPYIVQHGITGSLVAPGDASEFVREIARIWNDKTLCTEMGKAAQDIANRCYNQDLYFDNLISVYRSAAVPRKTSISLTNFTVLQ